jgi:hypothetical protein
MILYLASGWDGVSWTFCLGLLLTTILPSNLSLPQLPK